MTDTNRKSEKIELNFVLPDSEFNYKLSNTRLNFESEALDTFVDLINPTDISNLIFWGSAIQDATLYVDSGLATNVTANGDPIGGVIDLSGHENALQSVDAERPLWRDVFQGKFIKHDLDDDNLTIANLPAGDYTMCVALYGGTQVFEFTHNATGTYTLPVMDWFELIIYSGSITEKDEIITYLDTKIPPAATNEIWRFSTLQNSVSLTVGESSSGMTWLSGDMQSATGDTFTKTVTAPETISLRATTPGNITDIYFLREKLSGSFPDFTDLTGLTRFYFSDLSSSQKGLCGSIPDVSMLTSMQTFVVGYNFLVGKMPDITALTSMTRFELRNNSLSGSIGDLPNSITLLNLSNNNFTGDVPSLPSGIVYCYLSDNSLSGSMPNISSLSSLEYINLYNNELTGSISSLPASLKDIRVYSNQFTGNIPSFAGLDVIADVWMNDNQLSGYIGGGFSGSLSSAPDLYFQNNLLTQGVVDVLLSDCVNTGLSNGTIRLDGTGNAAPSAAGYASATTLDDDLNWTVSTN